MANSSDNATRAMNPNSLALEDAARVLTRAGAQPVTVDMLQADIEDGAPTNSDGTLNLVHYAAWLVGEMGQG